MAQINKNPALMALPSGIKRGIAAALDSTSVWYSYDLMAAYAKGGQFAVDAGVAVTSYVGQILTLIDETKNIATAYVIMDAAGTLQEVGAKTLGDEKTISLTNGILGLKNWGKEYYAWIEPVGEEGEDGYIAGHHQKQVVDADHPWLAGLEPKATTATDGTIEIAWYQPSTVTIQGVSSAITTVQNTVANLSAGIGSAEDEAGAKTVYGAINEIKKENGELEQVVADMLPLAGGTMTGDITMKDGSIAASEIVVDTKIAAAIGSAGHLKREIVDEIPDATTADVDTIYMVLNQAGDYNEYIKVNDKMELIGSTQVDLAPYMKKVEGATANNFAMLNANGEVVDGTLNASSFVSTSDFETYKEEVVDALAEKVASDDETYASLVSNAEKLANLPTFSSIGTGLKIVDGVLNASEQYELPIASDSVLGGVMVDNKTIRTTTEGVLSVQVVAENGLSIDDNGIILAAATTSSAGAMTAEQATKLANIATGAQINVIEGALLGPAGEEVDIDENKKLVLPIAGALPGLVKSSDEDNKIKVESDGTMSVNRVSTDKLYVPENSELILSGGSAF